MSQDDCCVGVVEVLTAPQVVITEPLAPRATLTPAIYIPGPAGPPGERGETGDPGEQGIPGEGEFTYVHVQSAPATTWTVTHNLHGWPNVTVVDSSGSEVIGEKSYDSADELTLVFSAAFAGRAFLS